MHTTTATVESMIARRGRQGHTDAVSRKVLNALLAAHDGDNLVCALVYEGFATERQAAKFAESRA